METDKTAASPPAPLQGERGEIPTDLEGIVRFITTRFPPAPDFQSSDIHMSTLELYNCINEFYPSEVYGPNDVFILLKNAGYVYDVLDGMRFVWLLRKIQTPI